MVFVKFHNMNWKKNSNVAFKLKQTQKVSLYKSKQYYNHSSKMFSFLFFFFFNLCTVYLKKMFVLSFSFFFFLFFHMLRSTIFTCLFFLFSFFFHLHCPVAFFFLFVFFFCFHFFSFFFSYHNKLLIQCLFFLQPYIYLSLSLP